MIPSNTLSSGSVRQADLEAPARRQLPRRDGHQAGGRPPAAAARRRAIRLRRAAIRIHGGYGYSTEFDVERYFRDAPLMIVGEGTNEIQRNIIARQLVPGG
jgi:alkylation response protein AidB-like acyl-CoA dehydrogenase